jgi:TRAP transporter 4TM/12TM fusion protein
VNRSASVILDRALDALAILVVAYHVLDVYFSIYGAMHHYTVHLGMVLAVVALRVLALAPLQERKAGRTAFALVGWLTLAIAVVSSSYLFAFNAELEFTQPFLTATQFAVGLALILAIFALNWIVWGAALTLVCVAAAAYLGFGHLVPGPVADLRLEPGVVMSNLAGMGSPRGVFMYIPLSADTILLLLVYGGLMSSTQVLDMFAELGKAIGNYFRGGVAYSCVAATSLIGMVTGQTVSCIALTGSMTIPTMVKGGFSKEEAGAIEVMAANGSQIIPPIMGLGAFLMAVIIGMPYVEIAKAAILPAVLYALTLVIGVYMLVHASPRIPFTRERVDWRKFYWILPSFVPSLGLVVILLSLRYSANLAAVWGIVVLLGLSFLRPGQYRPSWRSVVAGLREGVLAGAQLALILAAIGVIVQVLVTTGLGTEFSRLMIAASGRSVELALLIGMVIALVIGMGLPTPAAYSLCTIVMVPPLIDVGIQPLVAHFYAFYFAVLSAITPPVAVGILMAVRISGGSFSGTALAAIKLGAVCLLLPFFFVAFPNALQFPNLALETLFASVVICVGTAILGAAAYGHLVGRLSRVERLVLVLDALLLLVYLKLQAIWLGAIVVALFTVVLGRRWLVVKRPRVRPVT